ncbi:MAG: PqqD family protein [Nitrospira sp.]
MPATVPVLSERRIEFSQMFPQQSSDVRITVQRGESVLLNVRTGHLYRLNLLGSVVWPQCTGTHSVDRILSTIFETFDVTAAQAQSELLDVLVQLQQDGLLHIERR